MSQVSPENAIEHTVDESPTIKRRLELDLRSMFYFTLGAAAGACISAYFYSYRLPEAGPEDGIMYVVEGNCDFIDGFGPDPTPSGKEFFREIRARDAIVRIGILQKEVREDEVDAYIAANVPGAEAVRNPGHTVDPNVEVTLVMISCSPDGQTGSTLD